MTFYLYDRLISLKNIDILKDWHFEDCKTTLWTGEIPMPTFTSYLTDKSIIISKEVSQYIDSQIQLESTKEGQQLKLARHMSEIDSYIQKMEANTFLNPEYDFFIKDLSKIKLDILAQYAHLKEEPAISKIPIQNKIQWVGNINLLTTLFYDLLNGQEKGIGKNKITTPPLIKCQKKDIERLLAENFIDVNAKPLKESTISDYLNKSEAKSSSKLHSGSRIELPEK